MLSRMILLANAAFDEMLLLRSFPLFRSCVSDLLRNAAKANTIDASLILLSLGQYEHGKMNENDLRSVSR